MNNRRRQQQGQAQGGARGKGQRRQAAPNNPQR